MFRLSGEPSTGNTSSHPIRRSYGTQSPQLAMESSAVIEELCMRDDQYFNLLYKAYDRNGLGVSTRGHNLEEESLHNAGNSNAVWTPSERNKSISLFDFRQMDAELSRIQREYEVIEQNLSRVAVGAENRKPPTTLNNSTSNINLVDSNIRLHTRERVLPNHMDWSLSASTTALSAANARLRRRHSGILADISSSLQTTPDVTGTVESAAELPTTATSGPLTSSLAASQTVEQASTKNSNLEMALMSDTEPYKCPVCLSCVRKRKPAATMCGHVFCSNCIETALRVSCKCPVCQKIVIAHELFRVYI